MLRGDIMVSDGETVRLCVIFVCEIGREVEMELRRGLGRSITAVPRSNAALPESLKYKHSWDVTMYKYFVTTAL